MAGGPLHGIGYVLTADDPYTVVDLDADLAPETQQEIIERLWSYTERSPGGKGYHVWIRAEMDGRGRHPVGIGIFSSRRFITVTGEHA